MRDGAIFSGILHGVVILLLLIGLPELFRRDLEPPPVIPIDIINISDLTSAPALKVKPKDNTLEEDPKEKPKPPKPMPVADKEPEPKPEEKPEPEPEPEVAPEPEKTLEDLIPDEKPKEEKPKEKQKEKEKPKKKKKKKKSAFDSLMKNLDKTKSASEGKTQPEQDESSTADHAANNISDVLSVTEMDLVRRQMRDHWNPPAGKDAREISVVIRVEMNPDATVRTVTFVSSSKPQNAAYVKQSIDAAKRAVLKASPLKLPLDRYDRWKVFEFNFDPRDIL